MRRVIAAALLGAAVLLAALVIWPLHRRGTLERAMARDIHPGMPLPAVTAYLRRLDVDFTIDSVAPDTTIVRFWREVAPNGSFTEQQLLFDSHERLSDMRSFARVTGGR